MRRFCLPLLVVVFAGSAHAQRIELPDTVVGEGIDEDSQLSTPDTAAGADNTMLFIWRQRQNGQDERYVYGRRFSATGLPLGPAARLDDTANTSSPRVRANVSGGGYVTAWRHVLGPQGLDLRRLDANAAPVAPSVAVANQSVSRLALAALPSGTAVVWISTSNLRARLFDTAGQPRALLFTVATASDLESVSAAGTSDGGFVVVWNDEDESWGRRYDGDGVALGPAALLTDAFRVMDVAASPLGGFVIVGWHEADSHTQASGVWGRRFDATGAPVGAPFLIYAKVAPPVPSAEFDAEGNLYVAWSDTGNSDREPVHARVFDASGRALGPAFRVSQDTTALFATSVRPDGRMVNAWLGNSSVNANVVALCTPPYHVSCGDGVTTSPCERCDAGAGNSDSAPDTCRTNCQLTSCGDGVIDSGEECDDGNSFGCDGCDTGCDLEPGYACGDGVTFPLCGEECDDGLANSDTTPDACRTSCQLPRCGDDVVDATEPCDDGNNESCDGCSAVCVAEPGLVCGDGIPELACDEQCDDGNAIVGDGCASPCLLERIPGGGSPRTECLIEWSINNPSNLPLYDKRGDINGVQTCVDGDPQCDFDGAVSGSCIFALQVCANNTDIEGCAPPTRLASWELTTPSVKKGDRDPVMAAVRAAFASVPGSIVGPPTRDVCSPQNGVIVPLRKGVKTGKLTLKARAYDYEDQKDIDKLKLVCLPAG